MPLLKDGKIVDDAWTLLADDDAIPHTGYVVVSLERFISDRGTLFTCDGPIGIRLTSEQSPQLIAEALARLSLVQLEFPTFTDGRSYSYARLLHRLGFCGEIRAVGNILRDQYLNLKRCGFDGFELKKGATEKDWAASTSSFSVPYQLAYGSSKSIMSLREQRMARDD
jgi:uncharacterized protein (DUF934 family)